MQLRWNFRLRRRIFVTTCLAMLVPYPLIAQDKSTSQDATAAGTALAEDPIRKRDQAIEKGLAFLKDKGQAADGSFTAQAGPGLTALAVSAALRNGRKLDDPMVSRGLAALQRFVRPDGGIYGNGRLKNYETCISMVCFAEANKDGRYNQILDNAKKFVLGLQIGDASRQPSDPWYGGVGYADAGRPDLSNTGYFIEALKAVETAPNDPAIQRALAFVSRCQNLESEYNDTLFAAKVGDGGFYYEIPVKAIDPSTTDDRVTPNGGLRSYGSMTYTGLKSMVYAGLTSDDPRVKAAVQWAKDHYSVEENPGMGQAGLYYYYLTFARALDASGINLLQDSDGNVRNWKADLIDELASRQNEDGSWTNQDQRWFENDKNLATSFALLAISHCK